MAKVTKKPTKKSAAKKPKKKKNMASGLPAGPINQHKRMAMGMGGINALDVSPIGKGRK